MRPSVRVLVCACLSWLTAPAAPAPAQQTYRLPPDAIVDIVDAAPLPSVSVSPSGETMLLLERESLPPLAEMARPMLRLAGVRVDPQTHARHGPRRFVGLTLLSLGDGTEQRLSLPDDVGVGWPSWSPDGSRFAFTVTRDDGVRLWIGDVATASVRPLLDARLNSLGVGPTWMPDGAHLLAGFVPEGLGPLPERPAVPAGPVVQESLDTSAAPVRTYQDLLADEHDERVFAHLFSTQLALVDVDTGVRTDLGAPQLFVEADPAPSGEFLLVEWLEEPFSYLVPWSRFPRHIEIWDTAGEAARHVARLPLAESVPIGGVIEGPRSHRWRDSADTATLYWVEALDGGDPKRQADERDRVLAWDAPFDGEPREVARLEDRFSGLSWVEGRALALLREYDRDERWTRTWLLRPDADGATPRLLFDRSVQDRYGDPGWPLSTTNAAGRSVLAVRDGAFLLAGRGSSPEGDRPFLDRHELRTGETERLWRNAGEEYESVVALLPAHTREGALATLTRRETPTEPPNYATRVFADDVSQRRMLTDWSHPAPELLDVHKELVTYERDDGVQLSATLYLPPGYPREGDDRPRLPLLVWAYPREFNDPAMASQVSGSPYRFTMFGGSSHLLLLTQGYAVMDGATMPVVGADPETVNDTFIDQIVASAAAAIDEAAARGVADPARVGVGGHSYGAFMTANLLAHSDLFRAGVARSGAYNRTLTPFGFQAERRTFWEAPEVYFALSPFMHADEIDEPLLMIHGAEDDNSGTFPIQSERMYHAVKGHGGIVRLVMLPHESHGYRARESVMHTLAEMVDWFDRWVKTPTVSD